MAHKAPLLGLINQGKCLAVTHRAVLSRGSSLIAALSFMGGSLAILARVCLEPELPARSSATGAVRLTAGFFGGLIAEREPTFGFAVDWA